MENALNVCNYLSLNLRKIFMKIMKNTVIREIRLRVNQPLMVKAFDGDHYVGEAGDLVQRDMAYVVRAKDIKETLEYVSNYSLYAYEEDIKNGFITMPGGNRIGICGRVVYDEGERVKTIRNISFINIRIAAEVIGCSDAIIDKLYDGSNIFHTLIVSPPCCGKTTILRDIIRNVSDGTKNHAGHTVGIADERSEIAACSFGVPGNHVGERSDVLDGCPKSAGMIMLLRSMSPDVIAVDEIGGEKDAQAINAAVKCGCRILATVHASSFEELLYKPFLGTLMRQNIFGRIIILDNEPTPGHIREILDGRGNHIL